MNAAGDGTIRGEAGLSTLAESQKGLMGTHSSWHLWEPERLMMGRAGGEFSSPWSFN